MNFELKNALVKADCFETEYIIFNVVWFLGRLVGWPDIPLIRGFFFFHFSDGQIITYQTSRTSW